MIRIYDPRLRRLRSFTPLRDGKPRVYVCGPTVYGEIHIGNARPLIVFDLLFRLLRKVYGAEKVTYVRNITDIDDKINARAQALSISIGDLTERTIKDFHRDVTALDCLPPTHEPRATDFLAPMIAMIQSLIAKGFAYAAEGHVLFDVGAYAAYGSLSNRDPEDLLAGARVEVAPCKRAPLDFVLWKPSTDDLPGWESPWGRGRPGWHIECSVMAKTLLGVPFDIHGGGIDLLFPHHENESAQSCADGSCPRLANFWMHNGLITVSGAKMAKSQGNFETVRSLLQKAKGSTIRLTMFETLYRQPMEWTHEKVMRNARILSKWQSRARAGTDGEINPDLLRALASDLNTPLAIKALHALGNRARTDRKAQADLHATLLFMGLDQPPLPASASEVALDQETIERLIAQRQEARERKDFASADLLRNQLAKAGVILEDGKGTTNFRKGS